MRVQPIDVARFGAGMLDLLAARRMAAGELGHDASEAESAVFRVLGGRQIIQSSVSALWGFRAGGVVVDTLHLLSMIGLAAINPKRTRRAALTQSGIAAVFAVWGVLTIKRK